MENTTQEKMARAQLQLPANLCTTTLVGRQETNPAFPGELSGAEYPMNWKLVEAT